MPSKKSSLQSTNRSLANDVGNDSDSSYDEKQSTNRSLANDIGYDTDSSYDENDEYRQDYFSGHSVYPPNDFTFDMYGLCLYATDKAKDALENEDDNKDNNSAAMKVIVPADVDTKVATVIDELDRKNYDSAAMKVIVPAGEDEKVSKVIDQPDRKCAAADVDER